jgi:hypothetical protein
MGEYAAPRDAERIGKLAFILGAAALVLSILGGFANPTQFFRSYLVGFLLWFGVALGSLAILMLQHMTGGAWGVITRRPLEAGMRTIPLILLFFLPLLVGLRHLYPWTIPGTVTGNAALWLTIPFFYFRAALYFTIWLMLMYLFAKWSREQDAEARNVRRKFQLLAGPGMIIYTVSVSFAAVDWIMSLDPHWASSIFGLLIVIGQLLSAMAFTIAVVAHLAQREPLAGLLQPRHFHDLGKLLLAFTMVWAYFSFSQLLIIWAGNLPEEIRWYMPRMKTSWEILGVALILFHFALPFVLLLSRDLKRNARHLALVAIFILVMRWVDILWLIVPEFHPTLSIHWMDLLIPIGLGGLWVGYYFKLLSSLPLLPIGDSYLPKALQHGED